MATVTALRARPNGRVAVDLDGGPWRTLPAEPVVRAGLAVGLELDRERARQLRRELRRAEALAVATRALGRRELSSRGLAERLDRAAVRPRERDAVLETVARAGLVDDVRFAAGRAYALAERGYGDAAIASDLERRGIPPKARHDALAGLRPEPERAAEITARRGAGQRTARFLAAKGFGEEAVEAASGADFANGP